MNAVALFDSVVRHALLSVPVIVMLLVYRRISNVARQRDDAEVQRAFEAGRAQGFREGFVAGVEWRTKGAPYR